MPTRRPAPRGSGRRAPAPPPRRSPRTLGRGFPPPVGARERPLTAPYAAVFGVLVAAEDLYLGWLLWEPDPGWHWYVLVSALLAAWALAGAALVWLGRGRGWLVLAAAALLPLLGLLALAVLFGALGGGSAAWWAVLLLVGPVGCLVLALGRPIREWTGPRRATSSTGRGRRAARAR